MLDLKGLFEAVREESNCENPSVCILLSKEGRVVAAGANHCEQSQEVSADSIALRNMEKEFIPYVALLSGEFFQESLDRLQKAGVEKIKFV